MILLIDNFDSFSYNLYQLIGEVNQDIKVIRNDEFSIEQIEELNPDVIVISPGPGKPREAGICIEAIKYFSKKNVPILGICLGHQAICEAFGGVVTYAKRLMHGKSSEISLDKSCPIFEGLDDKIKVARYHSLVAQNETLPDCLSITAQTKNGTIMGLMHKDYPVYGLQFHPESILTQNGLKMIKNFFKVISK